MEVAKGLNLEHNIYGDGTLRFEERLCVPNDKELKHEVMNKAHCTPSSIHPRTTKMYRDLTSLYW